MKTNYLSIADGGRLAYQKLEGSGPAIVFFSGHGSDMFGSKAEALAAYCLAEGRSFLRFVSRSIAASRSSSSAALTPNSSVLPEA